MWPRWLAASIRQHGCWKSQVLHLQPSLASQRRLTSWLSDPPTARQQQKYPRSEHLCTLRWRPCGRYLYYGQYGRRLMCIALHQSVALR